MQVHEWKSELAAILAEDDERVADFEDGSYYLIHSARCELDEWIDAHPKPKDKAGQARLDVLRGILNLLCKGLADG